MQQAFQPSAWFSVQLLILLTNLTKARFFPRAIANEEVKMISLAVELGKIVQKYRRSRNLESQFDLH